MGSKREIRKELRRRMASQTLERKLRDLFLFEIGVTSPSFKLKARKDFATGKVVYHLTLNDVVARVLNLPKCSGFKPLTTIYQEVEEAIKVSKALPLDHRIDISA